MASILPYVVYNDNRPPSFPSWVPDWRLKDGSEPFYILPSELGHSNAAETPSTGNAIRNTQIHLPGIEKSGVRSVMDMSLNIRKLMVTMDRYFHFGEIT